MEISQPADTASTAIEEASQSLFRLGRAFGRLPRSDVLEVRAARGPELSAILVVQAVEEGESAGREVTIGMVAAELGVDPSTASRLVSRAVEGGYLRRIPAHRDRRAAALELTGEGRALGQDAARYQRAVFDTATAGWSADERVQFARLFVRFAGAIMGSLQEQQAER